MSKPKNRYDTESFWVVFEDRPAGGGLDAYSFNNHVAAADFVQGDPAARVGPFKMARLPLEQAAPILFVAARRTQAALTAYRNDPLQQDELLGAAAFLQAAADYASLEPHIADIYRATRRDLLQAGRTEGCEPRATYIEALAEHLLKYKHVNQGPLQ